MLMGEIDKIDWKQMRYLELKFLNSGEEYILKMKQPPMIHGVIMSLTYTVPLLR